MKLTALSLLIIVSSVISAQQSSKMQKRKGQEYFLLEKSDLSGYYETRAFTKWMLAFGNGNYL